MSETTPNIPAPTPPAGKPRRPWKKRIARWLVIVAVLLLSVRILFGILLPVAMNRVAGLYDLQVSYERSELNLLSGDVGLWHLRVTPKAGGSSVAEVGYLRGNISMLALLRLRLDVWRAEADGVDLNVVRAADGSIPLLQKLLTTPPGASSDQPVAAAAPGKPDGRPLDLTAPIRIDALRLQNIATRFVDQTFTPALETRAFLNLRLSDVGSSRRPTTLEVSLWTDPGLDVLRVEGTGKNTAGSIDADLTLTMRGLRLGAFKPYLEQFGILPLDETLSGRGSIAVHLKANPAPQKSVNGTIAISNLLLTGISAEVAGAKSVDIKLDAVGLDGAKVKSILVDDATIGTGRTARGNFALAGLEVVGGNAKAAAPATQPAVAVQSKPGFLYPWSVDELRVTNASASLLDSSFKPAPKLIAKLENLSITNLVFDPKRPDARANVAAVASIVDCVGRATLNGSAAPFSTERTIELKLASTGIRPEALRPYLEHVGFESLLQDASATADILASVRSENGKLLADAKVANLNFSDGGVNLCSFSKIEVDDLLLDDSLNNLEIGKVELVGPDLPVERGADGMIYRLGLRTSPGTAARNWARAAESAVTATTQESTTGGIVLNIPRVAIGQLKWTGVNLQWKDLSSDPPVTFDTGDTGLEVQNLVIDLNDKDSVSKPGTVRWWLGVPGIAEKLTLDGTVVSANGRVTADLKFAGSGITLTTIKPYLALAGIEPTLQQGNLKAESSITLSQRTNELTVLMDARDVRYADGDREIAAVDHFEINKIDLARDELSLGTIKAERPRLFAGRDAGGAILAGGMRVLPPSTQPTAVAVETKLAAPSTQPTPPIFPVPFAVSLKSIEVTDATIGWSDAAAGTPVDLSLGANLSLRDFVAGENPKPGALTIDAKIPGLIEAAKVSGKLQLTPKMGSIDLTIALTGLNADRVATYFPPGIEPRLKSGELSLDLSVMLQNAAMADGYGGRLNVDGLDYKDGEKTLAKVGSFNLIVGRFDPPGGVIAVDEVSSSGIEADVDLLNDGTPQFLGLAMVPPPPTAAEAPEPAKVVAVPTSEKGESSADVQAIIAESRRSLPLFTLEKLDLTLDRLTINNQMFEGAAPITVGALRLHNTNRLEWAGAEPESRPPTDFVFTVRVDPLVQSVNAQATVAPFARQPTLKLDLSAAGVRGDAVTELVPKLREYISGGRLTDGRFAAKVDAQLRPDRRGGGPADYSRGFGAEVSVTGTAFRNGADGPVLAGVELVRSEGIRVEPSSGNVTVKTVEVTKPAAYVLRDAQGVEVFGLLLKLPTEPGPATEPATPPAQVAEAPPASQPTVAAQATPSTGGEVRVDKLLVSGLDVRIEDRTVTPPMVIPLNSLDLEAAGLSSKATSEPRPMRFSLIMSSGKIELPGSGAAIVTSDSVTSATPSQPNDQPAAPPGAETRELFSQVAASGRVTLYPEPKGWTKLSVNGLELLSIRGFASAAGVMLGGGVLDASVDARFKEDGLIDTRNRIVLTDLSLSEPPNGPIQQRLGLPAPLDVAIKAVEDVDGSITLPINVPIKHGELQMNKVINSAAGAIGQVVITALASAPVKVVAGVGNLFGGGDKKKPTEPRTVTIDFAAGDAALQAQQIAKLQPLLAQLRKDKNLELTLRHEMAADDVAIAARRASPPAEDLLSIAARFRQQRSELLAERARLAAEVRGRATTLSGTQSDAAVEQLRELDRRIAGAESSLDNVLDQLKPGADRQADRRTRGAAIDLGKQRLDEVRSNLLTSEARDASTRVRSVPPQFAPAGGADTGRVVITLIEKKK